MYTYIYVCVCVCMMVASRGGRFGGERSEKGEGAGLVSAPYLEGGESVLN